MRRYSFSRPKHRSTTLRLQYASRSSCARPSDAIFSFDFRGLLPLYRYFSARCAMRALNTLYQPVPHVHGVSCCRSDAERQSRPEVVARTGFHELVRGLARYLTGGHFRLLPDGFWCQNRRESDPAHYLRRYRDVFLSTGGTFQRPDITAIQRGGRPVNKAVCIK